MAFTKDHWPEVLEQMFPLLEQEAHKLWFKNLQFQQTNDDTIILTATDANVKNMVQRFYGDSLRQTCQNIGGQAYQIVIEVPLEVSPSPQGTGSDGANAQVVSVQQVKNRQKFPTVPLDPLYTFENFIVGKNNQYCYAIARAVSEKLADQYNPLFIHGAVGLGKTHLLQAICHQLRRNRAESSIIYVSSDTFIEQLIDAIQQGGLMEFRFKYRYADVLLIDDIHYVVNKDRIQEEFFHIFNNLYTAHKQIILSSDSPPKNFSGLPDRLISRFKWGIVTQMEPPGYETRMAIIRQKVGLSNLAFPNEVVEYIAEKFTQNIRELEGAVWKLKSYADALHTQPTLSLAKQALSDLIHTSRTKITMSDIHKEITKAFQVKLSDLQSKKRSQSIAVPRQVGMYLAREFTDLSLGEIGDSFGGRDHSTVAHSIDKIAKVELEKNPKLNGMVQTMIENLNKIKHGQL